MDLISREAIKKYISAPCTYVEGKRIFYVEDLDLIGSPFEGMTYGEVMKAVLGIKDEQVVKGEYETVIRLNVEKPDSFMSIDTEVWDSPYKGVSK